MEIKLARSRKLEGVLSKPEVYKSMTTCHFQGVGLGGKLCYPNLIHPKCL